MILKIYGGGYKLPKLIPKKLLYSGVRYERQR